MTNPSPAPGKPYVPCACTCAVCGQPHVVVCPDCGRWHCEACWGPAWSDRRWYLLDLDQLRQVARTWD
jgi:hypothetical protein